MPIIYLQFEEAYPLLLAIMMAEGTDMNLSHSSKIILDSAISVVECPDMALTLSQGILQAYSTSQVVAEMSLSTEISGITFEAEVISEALLTPRLNEEANVFAENMEVEVIVEAAIDDSYTAISSDFLSETTVECLMVPTLTKAPSSELLITLDLLPPKTTGIYQQYQTRLIVDGVQLPIKRATYSEDQTGMDKRFNATLAKVSDKVKIKPSAEFIFEINDGNGWETIINSRLVSHAFSIGWANGPTDTFEFVTRDNTTDLLNTVGVGGLTIYDDVQFSLIQSDFPNIKDTEGRVYLRELIAVSNLSLYDIFEIVFQGECGYEKYYTNIPNFPIQRLDVEMGNNYIQSVSGLIGMFRPLIFPLGDTLCILDTTQGVPAGFPEPEILIARDYKAAQIQTNYRQLDGFKMHYVQNFNKGNYYTLKLDQNTETFGDFGDEGYQEIYTETTTREWRNTADPNIVLRSEKSFEKKVTTQGVANVINEERTDYIYDALGRMTGVDKKISALVPEANSGELILSTVLDDVTSISYGVHPFRPSQTIQTRSERRVRGAIAVDTVNKYLDKDFKQGLMDSHIAGNFNEDMDTEYGPLLTVIEKTTPLPNGQVFVTTQTTDHVRGVVLPNTISEPRSGDITVNSLGSQSGELMVFGDNDTVITKGRYDDFQLGEVPIEIGKALCRRLLKIINAGESNLNREVIGYDKAIKRGGIFTIKDRFNSILGTYLVEGFQINMDNLGTEQQTVNTLVQGIKV